MKKRGKNIENMLLSIGVASVIVLVDIVLIGIVVFGVYYILK